MKFVRPLVLFAQLAAAWSINRHYLIIATDTGVSPATATLAPVASPNVPASLSDESVRTIGPVARVEESETGLQFQARVDTGASRCSLHVEEWKIENERPDMEANVGRTIHFRLLNRRGQSQWLTRTIAEVALFRTSEEEETRYLVPLSLSHQGVERKVLVSLNDRSHMSYAMLLGRNYLAGEFVVDVSQEERGVELLAGSP